jgi:hypothetical protein
MKVQGADLTEAKTQLDEARSSTQVARRRSSVRRPTKRTRFACSKYRLPGDLARERTLPEVGLKFVSGALGATVRRLIPPTILGSVPESDEELIPSLPPSKNIACDIARLRHSPAARCRWRVPAQRKEGLATNCQACERPRCPMEPGATMWSIG